MIEQRVTSTLNAASQLRIYIDSTLHMSINMKRLVEVQSWKMTTRSSTLFVIERTYAKGASQMSDYDNVHLWTEVLREIDNAYGIAREAQP